jgi:hypothetical protein
MDNPKYLLAIPVFILCVAGLFMLFILQTLGFWSGTQMVFTPNTLMTYYIPSDNRAAIFFIVLNFV